MPVDTNHTQGHRNSLTTSRSHPDSLNPQPAGPTNPTGSVASQADLLYLTEIEHREVEWIWQDRLAAGSIAVLSGDPGSGKTWVCLAIAAALSKGQDPGNIDSSAQLNTPCTILYASAHYLGSQLIRPRFLKLGGDPARLVLLRGAAFPDATPGAPAAFGLSDTGILEDALQRTGARLLILDPMHTYLAAGGRHRAHEAALVFDNLAQLAEKYRCCILLVRHLRRRGRGATTIELSGAVRTEFLVGSSPDAPDFFGLVQTKSNLGPLADSLGYVLDREDTLAFHWCGPSTLTPQDLQTDRPHGAGLPQRKFAAEWLQRKLAEGPVSQAKIEMAAERDGLSIRTLRRARLDLGIFSYKNSFDGIWYWESFEGRRAIVSARAEAAASGAEKQ